MSKVGSGGGNTGRSAASGSGGDSGSGSVGGSGGESNRGSEVTEAEITTLRRQMAAATQVY